MVAPLSLCVLRLLFHLGDFRFHGFDQLCELFLAFLSCLCVDILGDAFAAFFISAISFFICFSRRAFSLSSAMQKLRFEEALAPF